MTHTVQDASNSVPSTCPHCGGAMKRHLGTMYGKTMYECERNCGYQILVEQSAKDDTEVIHLRSHMIAEVQALIIDAEKDIERITKNAPLGVRCERFRDDIKALAYREPLLLIDPLTCLAEVACLTRGFSAISKGSMKIAAPLYRKAKKLRKKTGNSLPNPADEAIWDDWSHRYRVCRLVYWKNCLFIKAANLIIDVATSNL